MPEPVGRIHALPLIGDIYQFTCCPAWLCTVLVTGVNAITKLCQHLLGMGGGLAARCAKSRRRLAQSCCQTFVRTQQQFLCFGVVQ